MHGLKTNTRMGNRKIGILEYWNIGKTIISRDQKILDSILADIKKPGLPEEFR